jgi:hypothetical protein
MNAWKPNTGLTSACLISTERERPHADLQIDGVADSATEKTQEVASGFMVILGIFAPSIGQKLHEFIEATDPCETGLSLDDQCLRKNTLALIAKAIAYIDRASADTSARHMAEHREG